MQPLARRAQSFTLAVVVACAIVGLPAPARGASPIMATGFRDQVVMSGLDLPTNVEFAPNGDIFVAEKSGLIKHFTSLSDLTPDVTANLQTQVYNYADKGLLGLAVDPQYPRRPYVYALFSYDAPIGGTAPKWGSATNHGNDPCRGEPNGPNSTIDGCTSSGRLIRLTVGANGIATDEKVLVEDWCNQFPSHSIGTVAFGPDGYLYAGGGDGASYGTINLDYGQLGGTIADPATGQPYTPRNPCGDPPGGVGGAMRLPTAQGGSLRAQDKRTTGDPTALNGTIIRIDPETGLAAPSNASYAGGEDENDRRIIAWGMRNPYRFTFRPGTNELWVGDVGAAVWEEIDRIASPTAAAANFGWPCYEGSGRNEGWDRLNVNLCEKLYAAGSSAVQLPYWSYRHAERTYPSDPCSTSGGVISGITFYEGGAYPGRLENALFLTDYARGCIWAMRAGTDGLPDPAEMETIEQLADSPVQLQLGPGGDVFYVDIAGGKIHRLVYSEGNQPPTIEASATPSNGPAPLTAFFDASASSDPDGDSMTFAWDLDADGAFDDASGPTAQWTYAAGTWQPTLRATDSHGAVSTRSVVITSGNTAPVAVIDTPLVGTTWSVGQSITFSGHASDVDEGSLDASHLSWRLLLHHCTGTSPFDCHQHIVEDFDGVTGGSFEAPDHELPVHLELRLTVTDSGGLATMVSIELQPKTVDLTFATAPPGLELTAGDSTVTGKFTRTFIVNGTLYLRAPTTQVVNGLAYAFSRWADGGTTSRQFPAPVAATTYVASYASTALPDVPDKCTDMLKNWSTNKFEYNTLSSTDDVDWYGFQMPSPMWTLVTLAGLPADYRLDLYSGCGELVASSNQQGTRFEEIYRRLPAGEYRVRVTAVSGVATTTAYGVRFIRMSDDLRILSSSAWTAAGGVLVVDGEVLNNSDNSFGRVQLRATYYNSSNLVIGSRSAFAYIDLLSPQARSPFRIAVVKPPDYDHYTVDVGYFELTEEAAVGRLEVSASNIAYAPGPSFRGTITNDNSFSVQLVNSVATLYDNWATVINTRSDWTAPSLVAPGAVATYSSTFGEHYLGWNRASVIIEGTR